MYNENQKTRYLNSDNFRFEENTKEVIESIFNRAARVEELEGMDLSLFNRPQVVGLLKSFNSKSKQYVHLLTFYFDDYYNWCLSEGLVDNASIQNYYDTSLSKGIIEEILPKRLYRGKYFTREQITEYLEAPSIDQVTKFIIYALFVGIYGNDLEDLINLKISDLDEENKTVKLVSGKVAHVDDVFIMLMKLADSAKYIGVDNFMGDHLSTKHRSVVYADSPYVIKPCGLRPVYEPIKQLLIRTKLQRVQKEFNNNFITATNLRLSGIIDYIIGKYESRGISVQEAVSFKTGRYIYKSEIQQYLEEAGIPMSANVLIKHIETMYGIDK